MSRAELIQRIEDLEKGRRAASLAAEDGADAGDGEMVPELTARPRDEHADLYDFALVGYVALDGEGVILDVNLTAAEMLGVKRALLLGVLFDRHVAREDGALFREHLARLSTPEQRVATELRLVRNGATELPVMMQSVLVRDEETDSFRSRTTITDIAERKRAELALRDNDARLQAILDAALEGIITIDETGIIESANPAAESMFGYAATELIGQNLRTLIPPPDREVYREDSRAGAARVIGIGNEVCGRRRDGASFPLDISVSEVRLVGRRVFAAILRDLTDRKAAEESLRARGQQQQALEELGQHALAGRDLDRLLEDAVSLVHRLLGVEHCKVLEIQPDGKALLLRAAVGWGEGLVGRATVPMGLHSQAGFTLLSGVPVIVSDLHAETRFHAAPLLCAHGVISGVSVIIHARGKPYGVLGADTARRRLFTSDDVHFLQSIANVLAAAIERRELEQEVLDISDEEQRRIGQDLHDDVCQQLVGIEFRLEALARELDGAPLAQMDVLKIGEFVRDATRHARMLARGLSPVEVEPSGLMLALQEMTARAEGLFRIECQYRCESPVLVPDHAAAMHLFRIAQEAVTNAVRHGHAERVVVALTCGADGAQLTIRDDGNACSTPAPKSGGMGLRTMQYRAEMIGATLRIEAAEGCGTIVSCRFEPASA